MQTKQKRKMKGWRVERRSNDRDEDLVLFRELNRRHKDRILTLLQPLSDEFEPNVLDRKLGNHELYRIPSAKKGSSGFEFLGKHDTDWLKTPPATPLFPSLEMEATGPPQLVHVNNNNNNQKHSTATPNPNPMALQQLSLSRFAAANPEAESSLPKTTSNGVAKSPNRQPPKRTPLRGRSITPSQIRRPTNTNTTSSTMTKKKSSNSSITDRTNTCNVTKKSSSINNTDKEKPRHLEFLAATKTNAHDHVIQNRTNKPRNRAVSPLITSTIPAQIPGFSHETPPNLITDEQRSISAPRGRPAAESARRPSVTRARKAGADEGAALCSVSVNKPEKDRVQVVLGSKMVEKVMNARKSAAATPDRDRSIRPKSSGSMNDTSSTGHTTGRMIHSNNNVAKPNPSTLWSHSRR